MVDTGIAWDGIYTHLPGKTEASVVINIYPQQRWETIWSPEHTKQESNKQEQRACLGGLLVHATQQHEQDGLLDVQVPKYTGRQRGRERLIDLPVVPHRQHLPSTARG